MTDIEHVQNIKTLLSAVYDAVEQAKKAGLTLQLGLNGTTVSLLSAQRSISVK